jgi:aldose 1-epimerase
VAVVDSVVLGGPPGPELHLLPHGATVHRLIVTSGDGVRRDVVLGYDDPADALGQPHYLGATVGRYANRIADGRFELDGREVRVAVHDRGNSLHGGPDGFDRRAWTLREHSPARAVLRLVSPDGDQGFPGNLEVEARFEVSGDSVELELSALTDATTVVNLTNHAYFNLAGAGSGSVEDHALLIGAEEYLPVDATGIPLGGPAAVAGTAFDLRRGARLGAVLHSDDPQIRDAGGLDHNFVLGAGGWRRVAVLRCAATGSELELRTDQPGLQVYTGNAFDGAGPDVAGRPLEPWDGIALEPQLPPDSPNRTPQASVLRPGERYLWRCSWTFRTISEP